MTDFGYSTWFANEDELFHLPRSYPWYAPEHNFHHFTPAQARKMDVFSFALLCLWVMFERYLSGIVPLPQEAHWADRYFQDMGKRDPRMSILEDLKQGDELVKLSRQLVMAEKDLEDDRKQALEGFFIASLTCDPWKREANLRQSLSRLIPSQQDRILSLQPRSPNTTQRAQPQVLGQESNRFEVQNCSFEVGTTI